jgi:hypothetical protein
VIRLGFHVAGARVEPFAAVPTLIFQVGVEATGGAAVESIALRCQIRIEPHRRAYSPREEARLLELFGETPRWGDTLKPFLWTHVTAIVPAFRETTVVDLPVATSYDLEVAAGKYLHALDGGELPLLFLFSGTIFARSGSGLGIEPVPWDRESAFRLPVALWRQLMDAYFPQSGWLRLRRETLDALLAIKAARALPTFDDVVADLLRDGWEARR